MTAKVLQLRGQVFTGCSPGNGDMAVLSIGPAARVLLHHLGAGQGVLLFSFPT